MDKSNNSLPSKEQQEDQNRITNGESKEEEEEEEHTIKIPFFSLEKYKKGLITTFDEIIGLF